ncbi:MAG: thioesterase family protein [Parvibaculum sp.]
MDSSIPATHPLDLATRLTPAGEGRFTGRTSPAYWNMMGPFGGTTAALMLKAALDAPARLGDPVALTVNFCAPIAEGDFTIELTEARTNRSTQHWTMTLSQENGIAATASAVFAKRRETWAHQPAACPTIPPFETLAPMETEGRNAWLQRYDLRFAEGAMTFEARADTDPGPSRSLLWVADKPERTLDFTSLASLADTFIVRLFLVRGRMVPAGTVSLTTYFHADAATLAAQGAKPLIGVADSSVFRQGYFDQSAELWSAEGQLLATSVQTVYYKE